MRSVGRRGRIRAAEGRKKKARSCGDSEPSTVCRSRRGTTQTCPLDQTERDCLELEIAGSSGVDGTGEGVKEMPTRTLYGYPRSCVQPFRVILVEKEQERTTTLVMPLDRTPDPGSTAL